MEHPVPHRWRFSLDTEDVSLRDLSWPEALQVARTSTTGDLAAQFDGECVQLEFNTTHAAVLYMGRDDAILRPYFPNRSPESQDLARFFCGGCGIRLGSREEYLSCFFDREAGFRLFAAVVRGPSLPKELPESLPGQLMFPGFEGTAPELVLEWRPLPGQEKIPS